MSGIKRALIFVLAFNVWLHAVPDVDELPDLWRSLTERVIIAGID